MPDQPERPASVRESDLADVSLVSLADLFASEDTVLAVSLRRVVDEVERSAKAISGWSSYVDETLTVQRAEESTDG